MKWLIRRRNLPARVRFALINRTGCKRRSSSSTSATWTRLPQPLAMPRRSRFGNSSFSLSSAARSRSKAVCCAAFWLVHQSTESPNDFLHPGIGYKPTVYRRSERLTRLDSLDRLVGWNHHDFCLARAKQHQAKR
jgi:hypothetical protein